MVYHLFLSRCDFCRFLVVVIVAADAILAAAMVALSLPMLFVVGFVVAADAIPVEETVNRRGG